jgi:hypothetical protein
MAEKCLSQWELEHWPYLVENRAIHHRSCPQCETKLKSRLLPQFVWAAESAGSKHNVSARAVLAMDKRILDLSGGDTSKCLGPDDVEALQKDLPLTAEVVEHIKRCTMCKSLAITVKNSP